ncbi:MAG: hypothetical protein ATN35_09255 [Epulopiscium sp. Nele67-Bin004]|nr:MAG: hypothetical protein ATN35_09255 [Epulopiscium sp. Nele67-Bin004]
MPDIMTHYFFGLDATNEIKHSILYQYIKDNRPTFFVGLQGPDPMYYHGLLKKNSNSHIGTLMHTENTDKFIKSLLKYHSTLEPNSAEAKCTIAYISGFLCHFILDVTTHPYVFYIGGRYQKEIPKTHKYKGLQEIVVC